MFKKITTALLLAAITLQAEYSYAKSSLTSAGDILQIAIPATAFGISTAKNDREGQKEFAKSFITTMGVTYAMKLAFRNSAWGTRPHGGRDSFPSGHSASAFGGAFFLQKRYGVMYGAPAIALAAFTGYTRVKGKYHHWRDVIGGTIVAAGANYFLVNRFSDEKVEVSTDLDKDQAMLHLNVKL